jgi:hypothetical protein
MTLWASQPNKGLLIIRVLIHEEATMAKRSGMYKSGKRQKELQRKKKQEEKRLKRQKNVTDPSLEPAVTDPSKEPAAADSTNVAPEPSGDTPEETNNETAKETEE